MKKKVVIFTLLIVSAVLVLFNMRPEKKDPRFVSMKDGAFFLHEKPFYPVCINYVAALRSDSINYWAAPIPDYGPEGNITYFSKDSSLAILKADFEMIKQMGFNSIRITHIGEVNIEDTSKGLVFIKSYYKNETETKIIFKDNETYSKYLTALDELIALAEKSGLKVILLVKLHDEVKSSFDHLEKVMKHFESDSTIFAYDLFNEPLYFDKIVRDKKDVIKISKRWQKFFREHAPNHLSTIGLTGIREVFEWDPNILSFDFISFHPYEYEPNQFLNELYWYGKYVTVPWIIGETSFPAENDSVKYEDQNKFAIKTLDQTCNCGGIGYSWWQYKDVKWGSYHSDYMGILNWKNTTVNEKGNVVFGTVKPLENVFKTYLPKKNSGNCILPDNYYNYSGYKDHLCYGTILDESDNPIEGAVIMVWNKEWNRSAHTVTKKDGSYELYSDFEQTHWILSATDYSSTRDDFYPEYFVYSDTGQVKVSYYLNKLKLKKINTWYKFLY
ncbi:MAG: carboxypeptidase regulatory-like domain-containing protein [Bacteroidetes bacterium]|nr:carboxypeptidase regulatory-like domain-containing protein [Bacteroidota bacterium]